MGTIPLLDERVLNLSIVFNLVIFMSFAHLVDDYLLAHEFEETFCIELWRNG
jgi:hypothetical protein